MEVYSIDHRTHFRVPFALLQLHRLHPDAEWGRNISYKVHAVLNWSVILLSLMKMFMEPSERLAEFMLDLLPTLRVGAILYKIYVINTKRARFNQIFENALTDISYPVELENEVEKYRREINRRNWCHVGIVVFTFLLPGIMQGIMFAIGKPTVFKIWLPFGLDKNDLIFGFLETIIMLTLFTQGFVVFGFSMLYVCLANLGVEMMRHLNSVLLTLHQENLDENWDERTLRSVVRYAIQQHQRCIALVDEVNAILSMVKLLDVWTYLYSLCTIAYYLVRIESIQNTQLGVIVALLQSVIVYSFYLWLSFWNAENFTEEGEKVATNCNLAAWWDWLPDLTQDVSTMAVMAKVKLTFRAGPFFSLSVSSFLAILEIAVTYLVVLSQFK